MEIFQTIWTALTTPNQTIINILSIPLIFIEITVTMLFFTTILNVKISKKQKLLYIFIVSSWTILSNIIIPKQINVFLNMIVPIFPMIIIFRISFLKSIIAEILPTILIALLDTIFSKFYFIFFNLT